MAASALRFWGSALAAAVVFAAAVPLLMPWGQLGLTSDADRRRGWLLTVFCTGIIALLFGAATWIGGPRQVSVRDVEEARGVAAAVEREKSARRTRGEGYGNPALWTMATGTFLVAAYFALWRALG